jgi:hypothetical protein
MKTFAALLMIFLSGAISQPAWAAQTLQTQYARLQIDDHGFVPSLVALQSGKEYSPQGHASPLLSLHESGQPNDQLVTPASAVFHPEKHEIELKYPTGALAVVMAEEKGTYFRFQLVSLTPRGTVDNVVWGPLHTTVSGKIGDIIGVVRNDDWAIGMMGLDDNTIAGPVVDSDCYGMGYYIHSPDPVKFPVPPKYKEGQWFNIGGNGITDTAFYSHPEEYFQQVFGTGAKLEPEFGSSVAYHARDRQKSYNYLFSLLPGFQRSRPRHQTSDPVEGVDFIGSGVALYACPDDLGPATMEKITVAEGLPYIVIDGKWIRDPSAARPILFWNGPMDKCIEYTKAMGFKDISRDTGEFYPSLTSKWVGRVGFSNGRTMTYKEFAEEAAKHGLTHGGLHTLCLFLQGGVSHDVTPVPSEHLQTVCRTKLAKDISATDTDIVVTDPSFLADKGTWPQGDDSNYLRIGGEMLRYDGISETAPWTIKGVKRGHASKAVAHKAGDELVKLQQNCYNGFVPDMKLLLDYAQYYGELMARNGMTALDFDGLESTTYENHGYYAVRIFFRRLFDTYYKLTGKYPRITGSNVFAGGWEYMDACNVGGGDNMFNVASGRWNIEGKDIRNGFENSYYPGTFGIQGWHSDWSQYEAENIEAKSIGWFATYSLTVSADALDNTGDRDEIFKAFHAWEAARAANVFTKEQKLKLQNPDFKFHLEQVGDNAFKLYTVKETALWADADGKTHPVALANDGPAQPMDFALTIKEPWNKSVPVAGIVITLPDGSQIKSERAIKTGEFIICKGGKAYVAGGNRKKVVDLVMDHPAMLPTGDTKFVLSSTGAPKGGEPKFMLTVRLLGKAEDVGK